MGFLPIALFYGNLVYRTSPLAVLPIALGETGFFRVEDDIKRAAGYFALQEANDAICVDAVVAAADRSGFVSRHGGNDGVGTIAHITCVKLR